MPTTATTTDVTGDTAASHVTLRPAHKPAGLTRLRQFMARKLYGAANVMEEVGWRLDKQEWVGAGSAPESDAKPEEEHHSHIPPAGYVGAAIVGGAAVIAAVGWKLIPHGSRKRSSPLPHRR